MFTTPFNLADLDGSNGFTIRGIDEFDGYGGSVSGAGDINGDGIDDIIIGAPSAGGTILRYGVYFSDYSGESYVVFGSSDGFDAQLDLADLDGSNGFALRGSFIGRDDYFGESVSGAGDINGDGIDDIIIGAPNYDGFRRIPYSDGLGESYVIFGSSDGFNAEFNLGDLDGSNGFVVIPRIEIPDRFGASVSGAGDINGDGIDDIIIGAPDGSVIEEFRNGSPYYSLYSGESYVVFGSSNGFDAELNLADLDGSNGFILNGVAQNDNSGSSVDGAGDINGDGIDDIIIGASRAEESYVVFGNSEGFAAEINLADLDGSNGFVLRGVNEDDRSGDSISSAGDINGDGIDDLIIGASRAEESYVVFGNSEGFAAEINLADLDGSNGFVLRGFNEDGFFGNPVSGAGDINGDGIDDLIIGAPSVGDIVFGEGYSFSNARGESYVVFGSSNGFDASLDLANLDGNNGFALRGVDEYDLSGASVSEAGDVNGDGIDDIIIGAPFAGGESRDIFSPYNDYSGEVYVVFGRDTTNETDIIAGTENNDSLTGTADADTILGGDGADTIRGNLGNDSLEGNNGFDRLFGDRGDDTLIGGRGSDTLRGGADNDRLEGNSGRDILFGNNGNDVLVGGNGNDILRGNLGSDTLNGGVGNDTLRGGSGSDFFVLKAGEGRDLITDYFDGSDKFLLADGLEFEDLSIVQNRNSTQIELTETDEILATLNSITANFLNEDDFVSES